MMWCLTTSWPKNTLSKQCCDTNVIFFWLISAIFYRTDHPIWGYVTIAFTFGPAILAFILGKSLLHRIGQSFLHLPGIQLFPHLYYQSKVLKTDKKAKECDAKAIKAQSDGKEEEAKQLTSEKDKLELRVHDYQSKLNSFKSHEALAESFPQTVLQMTIKVKEGFSQMTSLGISAIVSSFLTLLLSLSGLIVSLPFYVDGERRVQFKSFSHLYLNILPLTSIGVLPRLMVLVMFFSTIYVGNAWFAITILAPLIFVYLMSYWSILYFYVRPKVIEEKGANHQDNSRYLIKN